MILSEIRSLLNLKKRQASHVPSISLFLSLSGVSSQLRGEKGTSYKYIYVKHKHETRVRSDGVASLSQETGIRSIKKAAEAGTSSRKTAVASQHIPIHMRLGRCVGSRNPCRGFDFKLFETGMHMKDDTL